MRGGLLTDVHTNWKNMLAVLALFLLCSVSVSQPVRTACDRLIRPVAQPESFFEGAWAVVAASADQPASMEALRLTDSITLYFSKSSETPTYLHTQIRRVGDQCRPQSYNLSIEENTYLNNASSGFGFGLRGYLGHTSCPDCVMMPWLERSGGRLGTHLYLMSRRRRLEQKEMEEFEAQLRCFFLDPPPVVMEPAKELCENTQSQPEAAVAALAL